MFSFLSDFFLKNGMDTIAPIPLSACIIRKKYLLERAGIADGTVFCVLIPYYTEPAEAPLRNLSAYAVSADYHLFWKQLSDRLLPLLSEKFPENRFAAFADHSPIDEIDAAAKAGLGVIGKNHLLLTEKYSSFVFLGEVITDAFLPCRAVEIGTCSGCGACQRACPAEKEHTLCLSALTQKKGSLTAEETALLRRHPLVWGCDICQEVCPYTKRAKAEGTIHSPIPFFRETAMPVLTLEGLDEMDDTAFSSRAFSWRGRETIRRNLLLHGKGDVSC